MKTPKCYNTQTPQQPFSVTLFYQIRTTCRICFVMACSHAAAADAADAAAADAADTGLSRLQPQACGTL